MMTSPEELKPAGEASDRESGRPGGGQGRIDEVGWSGVYPGSGPYPAGPAEIRTPGSFVHGQWDAEGRPVEGGSELTYLGGDTLLGGSTPPSSSPPEGPANPGPRRGEVTREAAERLGRRGGPRRPTIGGGD